MSDYPPPPPPPPPPSGPPAGGPAPLESVGPWPRFGARIVDGLVLLIPNLLIGAVFSDGTSTGFGTSGSGAGVFVAGVISALLGFGYAVYLESTTGATIGKKVLKLKVVGLDGGNPSTEMAAKRNAWLLLSILPILGGIASFIIVIVIAVTISNDPFNRGAHDNFAGGSAVVRAR